MQSETTTINMHETRNAGRSSYIPNTPPRGFNKSFHTNTVIPPESIPAIAPALLTLFQKSENKIIGPNVAPNPDHANETTSKITLFSFHAIAIPTAVITRSIILESFITCLSVASFLIIPSKRFFETAEAAMRRYESEELIVAARIPAITTPARSGWKRSCARCANTFSAPL